MLEEILRRDLPCLGLEPDALALERCGRYAALLAEKNAVMNLTAIQGEEDTARLHFLDSAALLGLADFAGRAVVDVGTGAGFPGLVLKILCPDMELTLLDSLDKRIGFLRETCEQLALTDVRCLHARAEEAAASLRGGFDIAVSRAVARLNVLCELCLPLVKTGGLFIAMKGPEPEEELREAQRAIALLGGQVERCASYPVPGAGAVHSAVLIRKTGETPPRYPRRWAQIKKTPL